MKYAQMGANYENAKMCNIYSVLKKEKSEVVLHIPKMGENAILKTNKVNKVKSQGTKTQSAQVRSRKTSTKKFEDYYDEGYYDDGADAFEQWVDANRFSKHFVPRSHFFKTGRYHFFKTGRYLVA